MKKRSGPSQIILGCVALVCLSMVRNCSTCQPYGARATSAGGVNNCCTEDSTITSTPSGFCEGGPGPVVSLGFETSIAFAPTWTEGQTAQPAHLVVAYNDIGASGFLGWAFSKDQGRTWTARNRTNGGKLGGAVDNPPGPFVSFRGDPSVVALGPQRPGVVAMVTLGTSLPCAGGLVPCPPPDRVVLLVSLDGGETFSKTSLVNDAIGIGTTDQPRVTVDLGDGTIWVLWRTQTSVVLPFYAYVRGGSIDASGSVSWFNSGQLVMPNPLPTADYQHPRIKVFKRSPSASLHTIAISGPQAMSGTAIFPSPRCFPATTGTIRNSFWQVPLGVFFTVSEDDGQHWTDPNSAANMNQPYALGCVGGVGGLNATGQLLAADHRIDLARDPANRNYLITRAVAVSDPTTHSFVGQTVEIWRRSTDPGATATFRRLTTAPLQPGNSWQFNPSIAASDNGRIAVTYYEAVGATQTVELMAMGSRDGGDTWSAPLQLSRNSRATAADRSLGEYDEIIALPENVLSPVNPNPPTQFWPGMFYASWSNGIQTQVFVAGFSPPPAR